MPPGAVELSYLEKKVLLALGKLQKASPEELRGAGKFRELVEVMNAASWLQSKGLVTMKERVVHSYRLARPEVARRQLPERKALKAAIKAGGRIEVARLKAACKFGDADLAVALGWLRRKAWAEVSKGVDGSFVVVTQLGRAAAKAKGSDEILLARLAKGELTEDSIDPHVLRDLKSRRELVKERESVRREIALTLAGQKVLAAGIELKEEVAQPTTDLLRSGKWRSVDFRRYDTKAFAPLIRPGKRHVLGAYIERIRRIFLSMGFTEIQGDFVPRRSGTSMLCSSRKTIPRGTSWIRSICLSRRRSPSPTKESCGAWQRPTRPAGRPGVRVGGIRGTATRRNGRSSGLIRRRSRCDGWASTRTRRGRRSSSDASSGPTQSTSPISRNSTRSKAS